MANSGSGLALRAWPGHTGVWVPAVRGRCAEPKREVRK